MKKVLALIIIGLIVFFGYTLYQNEMGPNRLVVVEYNGGGHMGDSPENNIQGYSIPEGMLIGDELDLLITADPGADVFICTINKDGSKHVRKCSIVNYEYYIDSYERGGYRIHLTGASNISKFIIAYNERNMLNAGFIYIKKKQFKLD